MSKKRKSNFKGKVTKDAERQKKATASYGYLNLPKDVRVFTPDPGCRIRLDILPYEVTDEKHPDRDVEEEIAIPGSLWYKRPFRIHRNIGADNSSVVCLTSIGKKCPICEERSSMIKAGADKDDTNALKPSLRNLYVVIPIDSKKYKKYEEKPHIWDMSQFLFQDLLNEELEENEENAVFPDLEEGLTLKIRFDSSTIGNSKPFAEASRIDFQERDSVYEDTILDDVPNLDNVLNILSYKELEAKFLEIEDEETNGKEDIIDPDEEDGKSSKQTHRKKKETESKEKPKRTRREHKEEEKALEKPKHTRREYKEEEKAPSENKCPHGYEFGKDCEEYDECDTCDKWEDCSELANMD